MTILPATQAWLAQLNLLYHQGHEVVPRGKPTRELVGTQVKVDMRQPMVLWPSRKLNYRFMAGEAWWILSGSDRVVDIAPFNSKITAFSDDGLHFSGAYGPKVVDQIDHAIKTLSDDWASRQAVINIWREKPGPSRDIPCTLSLQFLIRENRGRAVLDCVATMRSSDVWLGLPYDIFNFSMIAASVALGVSPTLRAARVGTLHLTMGSSHLYEHDAVAALNCLSSWKQSPHGAHYNDPGDFEPNKWFTNRASLLLWLLANAQQNWVAARNLTGPDHQSSWYELKRLQAKMEDEPCDPVVTKPS